MVIIENWSRISSCLMGSLKFYGPSAKRAGHENKEGKKEDP